MTGRGTAHQGLRVREAPVRVADGASIVATLTTATAARRRPARITLQCIFGAETYIGMLMCRYVYACLGTHLHAPRTYRERCRRRKDLTCLHGRRTTCDSEYVLLYM
jgi:hypothetical protein